MKRHPLRDKHHAFPRSRFISLVNELWNIRTVTVNRHRAYHLLFDNLTPCEAAIRLLLEFGPECIGDLDTDPGLQDLERLLGKAGR